MNGCRPVMIARAVCVFLCATPVFAAKDFSVVESLIAISPPDASGRVTVSGPPRTVFVGPHTTATFTIENKSAKPKQAPGQGLVGPDGSFSACIPGAPGDKIKLKISPMTGRGKSVTLRVPPGAAPLSTPSKASLFSQSAYRPWVRPAVPTPEITINYRDKSSQPASSPLDPDAEVRGSGVLPPD